MCMCMCMYAHQSTFVYVSLLRGAISKNTSESSACGCSGRGSKPTWWPWSLVGSSCRSIERHRPNVALARLRDGRWRGPSAYGAGPEPTTNGAPCTPQTDHVSTRHPLAPFDRAKHGLPDSTARFPSQAGGPQQRHWQNFRCTRAQSMLAGQRIGRR